VKVSFRITLDDEVYQDVVSILKAVPKPLRGEYIAEAVRYLRQNYLPTKETASENKTGVVDFTQAINL